MGPRIGVAGAESSMQKVEEGSTGLIQPVDQPHAIHLDCGTQMSLTPLY